MPFTVVLVVTDDIGNKIEIHQKTQQVDLKRRAHHLWLEIILKWSVKKW